MNGIERLARSEPDSVSPTIFTTEPINPSLNYPLYLIGVPIFCAAILINNVVGCTALLGLAL